MLLYKFRSLERLERIADILVAQRLYCPRYFDLNDPFEGVCIVRDVFENPQNASRRYYSIVDVDTVIDPAEDKLPRVCCLSGSYHDIRLWSHYAGGHKGIAVEIDFSDAEKNPAKVEYHRGLDQHNSNSYPSLGSILTHKTYHWEHEDEYRILETEEYFSISGRIKRVLLGPRFKKRDMAILEKLVPAGVSIERTKLNEFTLQVETRETHQPKTDNGTCLK